MTYNYKKFLFRSLSYLYLGLFLALNSPAAYSAIDSWSLNSPQGGVIQALTVDPNTADVIYAGTSSNGVFKSIDGGDTWEHKSSGLANLNVQVIAVDPLNSDLVLAGTNGGGIFRSANGGDTWSTINTLVNLPNVDLINLNVYSIVFDPNNPNMMYAGTFGNVFSSSGRESTSSVAWERKGVGTGLTHNAIQTIAADPNNAGTFYAGTFAGGVFQSTDSMNTWVAANASNTLTALNIRHLTLSNTGNLYAGTQGEDGGFFIGTPTPDPTAWTESTTGLASTTINAVVESRADPNILFAASHNNAYRSTDAGATWTAVGTDLSGLRILSIAIDYNTNPEETVYAGTTQGVYKIANDGTTTTWTQANTGISAHNITDIAIDSVNPSLQYAATLGSGVLKTTDSGANWQYVNSGLADLKVLTIALDGGNIYIGTEFGGAYKSIDGGATWTSVQNGLGDTKISHIIDDSSSSDRLYAANVAGIRITSNGGATWAEINGDIADNHDVNVQALAIDPASATNRRIYLSTKSSGIFYSSVNSIAWTNSSQGLTNEFIYAIVIDPGEPNTLYVGTRGGGVFKSVDRGASWVGASSGLAPNATNGIINVNAIAIAPNNSNIVYAGTETHGVFRSLDGGQSWSETNSGLDVLNVNALTIHPTSYTLYAGTQGGGIFAIDFSSTNAPSNLTSPIKSSPDTQGGSGGSGHSGYLMLLALTVMLLIPAMRR